MNCQHCNVSNDGGWFYCRECGKRAHPPKFTTNSFMRGEFSKRSDIELNSMSLEESTSRMAKNTMDTRLKSLGVKPL